MLDTASAEGGELAMSIRLRIPTTQPDAARMADLVLIPCRPSILDLDHRQQSGHRQAGSQTCKRDSQCCRTIEVEADEAEEAVIQLEGGMPDQISEPCVAYARAIVYGQAAQEFEPHGKIHPRD